MNFAALKAEITLDPAAIGYGAPAATSVWDTATADKLNATGRTGEYKTFTAAQLFECLDQAQYVALTAAQQQQLTLLLSIPGDIAVGAGSNALKWWRAIFPSGKSRTELNQATARTVSRAVELGLVPPGELITPNDVAQARLS